jgi:hypothetical protein
MKAQLHAQLAQMPMKKMKLSVVTGVKVGVFLNKDALTLARYRVKADTILALAARVRVRKK